MRSTEAWLDNAEGQTPQCVWSVTTDGPLTSLSLARETGQVLAADNTGGVYLFSAAGQVQALTRLGSPCREVRISDNAASLLVTTGEESIGWLSPKLAFLWTRDVHDAITAIALAPHGGHGFVGMSDGSNVIFTAANRKHSTFDTIRPLRYTTFLGTEPAIIGAAEHGLLTKLDLAGTPFWKESLWTTVGDMTTLGNGSATILAGFMHGLQLYDADGRGAGTLMLDGTVNHVAVSYQQQRLYVSTLEQHLSCLNRNGDLVFLAKAPEPISHLAATAAGDAVIVGFESGRILKIGV